MILKQIDDRTVSLEGQGMVAVIAADDAFRWAWLFAHAENVLIACKDLLAEIEEIVVEIGWGPEGFPQIRDAREAIAAAERGGGI